MDDNHRELANRLFATATAMLEDAIGIAVAGQSARCGPSQLAATGRRLQIAVREIGTIAEAAVIVAAVHSHKSRRDRKSRP
jgi:hypothetical protein